MSIDDQLEIVSDIEDHYSRLCDLDEDIASDIEDALDRAKKYYKNLKEYIK